MTDHPPDHLDLTASDALDAGATDRLEPGARRRAEQFAEVRARLRDDTDAPRGPQLDAMVAEALHLAGAREDQVGTGAPDQAAPRRRAPVAWLTAAALVLIVVAAVAVVGTVDRDDASEDAAVVLPAEADAPGAGAEATDAPGPRVAEDRSATEASPGAPTTAAAAAPDESADSGQPSPPTPGGAPATASRVAAMAGARVTVVVPLR